MAMAKKLLTTGKKIALGLLVTVLVLALIEGLCSFALFTRDVIRTRPVAERTHTEYDETLGWINTPGADVKDMYGPGVWLKTNAQRFRNTREFAKAAPAGKIRAICTGDSFALGYGVDNDHTWSQLLAAQDDRIEPVNMGQGGYGVDQAYLWYLREKDNFDHDVVLFSFVSIDFERMRGKTFLGYPKPLLQLTDGKLEPTNVPVPRTGRLKPWLAQNGALLMELKILRMINGIVGGLRSSDAAEPGLSEDKAKEVAAAIFAELKAAAAARGAVLVLVHLPMERDCQIRAPDAWRRFVIDQAAAQDIALIDLVEDIQTVRPEDVPRLFIAEDIQGYPRAAGHYTTKGNARAAKWLYQKLVKIPALAGKFGPATRPARSP